MNNYKYLFKNIGLLTLSQFGTKFISFFLIPLYTNVLTTSEYGTYDLFNTTVGLFIPIFTLNIVESSLRFSLDKDVDNKSVFSISISYVVKGSLLVLLILIVNHVIGLIQVVDEYSIFFFLMFVISAFNGVITYFARGIDRILDISISGIISSVIIIGLNILFLIPMKMGIAGYFLANIIGIFAQTVYLFIRIQAWVYIDPKINSKKLQKRMVEYSKPLVVNSIAWWINNASDRYIVIWLCGLAANGVYSVGYKLPSVLNIFQTIFNQAWALSAIKDFDPEDKNGFFSKMYNLYNFAMVVLCSILIVCTRLLATILYAKDFFVAWKYVPFLMIAIVFGSLSGYIGGIFFAVKDSKIFTLSTVIGAVSNLLMNVVLVYLLGPLGAAIATAASFWLVWVIRLKHLKKYMKIKLNILRDYLSYFILVVQSFLLLYFQIDSVLLYTIESLLTFIIVYLYTEEVRSIVGKIIHKNP